MCGMVVGRIVPIPPAYSHPTLFLPPFLLASTGGGIVLSAVATELLPAMSKHKHRYVLRKHGVERGEERSGEGEKD